MAAAVYADLQSGKMSNKLYTRELTEYALETGRHTVSDQFAEELYYASPTLEFRQSLADFKDELQAELDILEL